eukprot:4065973-Amphidinium_carterae.1
MPCNTIQAVLIGRLHKTRMPCHTIQAVPIGGLHKPCQSQMTALATAEPRNCAAYSCTGAGRS